MNSPLHDGRIEGISGINHVPVSDDIASRLSRYLSDDHRLNEDVLNASPGDTQLYQARIAIHQALQSRWVSIANALGTQKQYDMMLTDLASAALSGNQHLYKRGWN